MRKPEDNFDSEEFKRVSVEAKFRCAFNELTFVRIDIGMGRLLLMAV
jgi:hypothetical protein